MSDLDIGRSYYYEFLSYPLFYSEDKKRYEEFIEQAIYLAKNPIEQSNEADFANIIKFSFDEFKKEQNSVLFDLSYTNIPLSASFYDEGRDDGNKRLKVIEILKRSNFRRDTNRCSCSEDYLGFIFKLMATILKNNLTLSRELFETLINEFSDEFAKMTKEHEAADFFRSYANIYINFISLERAILGFKAPKFEKSIAEESLHKKPFQTKMATPKSKVMWDEFTKI
ncbi:molecular chaperone TorD family protein [Campylobacter fetus]|uniref:molecular chaperone TorD family protein n=1 Tax=Campylobacter fetus TaxID=196 RepID=UPI000818C733|nr:molecular chaperone TorD family protein [Campylobacter fetus]OCR93951.1 formate dehydrogenase-specific chaperone [Campylobacter fetus subsp. testudinum]